MRCLLWALMAQLHSSLDMAALEKDVLHDKNDDAWTTSSQFKRDLVALFSNSSEEQVLEVGAHLGHCTRVLARLFRTVLALEHSPHVLKQNAQRNADLANVVYLRFHSVLDDWTTFASTRISAVFIDAAHDYASVRHDLDRALALPEVHSIVLDDYGTRTGVHQAVHEVLQLGQATLKRYVGRAPPWSYDGRTEVLDWEGVVLEPVRTKKEEPPLAQEVLGSWLVFPAGVFSTGYFVPHGHIDLASTQTGTSSYGALEWRQAIRGELGSEEEDRTLILQVSEPPYLRMQCQVNAERTGMAILRNDGVVLVAVRKDMMRVIGDKLLSFLH